MTTTIPPDAVLQRWSRLRPKRARPFGSGLINHTFLVEIDGDIAGPSPRIRKDAFVLQQLHPVFGAAVNDDIDAVTRHLESKRMITPRVLAADDGALYAMQGDERPWRALTCVQAGTCDRVTSTTQAQAAAKLVAQFHQALADFQHDYLHVRAGVHDTAKHRAHLQRALVEHAQHRLFTDVQQLATPLLAVLETLPDFRAFPLRHSHGDLKISNLLFSTDAKDEGVGVCLVDLDTVGRMAWPHEMGDALRSWTNPAGENVDSAVVDEDIFAAAVRGYFCVDVGVSDDEADALVVGFAAICLELSSRFLADALFESYFGFDATRFSARGEHNLLRARGQFALGQSVLARRGALETIVRVARRI